MKDTKKYLESYFKDEKITTKDIQDLILIVCKEDDVLETRFMKKKNFLQYLYVALPNIKNTTIRRQVNNLLQAGVLKIWRKYKTKPFVVKGRLHKYRWGDILIKHRRTTTDMLFDILMGDDPAKRLTYITDHWDDYASK